MRLRLPVCATLLLAACASDKPWHPGAFHPEAPHVIAGAHYGEWMPEPGYAWDDTSETTEDAGVHWAPGTPHPFHPHAVAGPKPDEWFPADGFEWAKDPENPWKTRPAR